MEELKPSELMLGNWISCFGEIVMVTGITPRENNSFFVSHTGMKTENPLTDGVEFSGYPVILTERWKRLLKIEQVLLPDWIKYVHEAQNYMLCAMRTNLLEVMDFSLVPIRQDLSLEAN